MADATGKIKKPSVFLLLSEGGRAVFEYGLYMLSQSQLKKAKKGDGHPVLVLPGLFTSDFSTKPLRSFLSMLGYKALPWGLGRNLGDYNYVVQLEEKLEKLYKEHNQKISIIGWSLGGVYARELARLQPKYVRQVITLGSPFAGIKQDNNIKWLYEFVSGKSVEDLDDDLLADILTPPPVPATAIFSKGDGVVSWEYCMEAEEGPTTQNVQVRGSHSGLGHNPITLLCIADRLAQPEGQWRRFQRDKFDEFFYPILRTA